MPRIRSYHAEQSAQAAIPGHAATGSDLGATAGIVEGGKALISLGDTLNDVAQRQEVSDVHTRLAKARADLSLELEEAANKAPAGDTTFKDKFVERTRDYLSEVGVGLSTRGGRLAWDQGASTLSAQLLKDAGSWQMKLAGAKASQDYLTALDANRNVLLRDPLQFQPILAYNESALNDPNGIYARMPALDREKLKRTSRAELAVSAVQGVIAQNPQAALEQLNGGAWGEYLDADKTFTLKRTAEIAINAQRVEQERARIEKERAEAAALDATRNKYMTMILAPKDGDAPLTATQIANDPSLAGKGGAAVKEHLILLMERRAKENPSTDEKHYGPLFQKLWDRTHASEDDATKLRDENELNGYLGNGLTVAGVVALRGEIQGRRTLDGAAEADQKKYFIDQVKSDLTKSNSLIGVRDPKGDEQLKNFMIWFIPEYARQRKAGKTPAELLDSNSKDYLGKTIPNYRRSTTQIFQDIIEANGRPAGAAIVPPDARPVATDRNGIPVYNVGGRYVYKDGQEYKP